MLESEHDVRCNVRLVYPIAVRTPEFFGPRDPLWVSYFMIDVFCEAEWLGLPLRWPRLDPVKRGTDGGYPKDQPYIRRLTHLMGAARARELYLLSDVITGAQAAALGLTDVLDEEAIHIVRTMMSEDHKAAAKAFVEKRASVRKPLSGTLGRSDATPINPGPRLRC